jgi:AcrR family transcriptional regulator
LSSSCSGTDKRLHHRDYALQYGQVCSAFTVATLSETGEAVAIEPNTRETAAQVGDARERLVRTAHALFHRNTLNTVGVDRIVAEAGVAKTTLYRHFSSKDGLAVSVLRHHEDVWTRDWLEQAIERHGETPGARLLGIFDAFDDWFRRDDYEGCLFARTLLETRDPASPVRTAAAAGLERVRALIRGLAEDADAHDPDAFALQIQMLLLGATVAAVYGDRDAAQQARDVARLLLEREGVPTES